MYGWRARIGYICPASTIDTPGYEFYRMAPQGVTMVGTILGIRVLTDEDVSRALEALDRAAEQYSKHRVDIVIMGGSPPVTRGGMAYEEQLAERMKNVSGIQSYTSQGAQIAAFKALRVEKVAVAGPYDEYQTEKLKQYIEMCGLSVVAIKGLGLTLEEMPFLPTEKSYRLGREVASLASGRAQGIYLPCAQWPTVENITALERDSGLPVVTAMQALLWYCLRKLGIREKIQGFGKLFEIDNI